MVKAFDFNDGTPTETWIGTVYENHVDPEEFVYSVLRNYHLGGCTDQEAKIAVANISETERPNAIPGMLFYCDVTVEAGLATSVRSVEFSEELTKSEEDKYLEGLANLLKRDRERRNKC